MRSIKLTFSDEKYIDGLINDKMFMADITYLQPNRLDRLNLALYDPVAGHHQLDTEIVVLNKFVSWFYNSSETGIKVEFTCNQICARRVRWNETKWNS